MHEHWREYGPPAYRSLAVLIKFEGKSPDDEADLETVVVTPRTEEDVRNLLRSWGQNV